MSSFDSERSTNIENETLLLEPKSPLITVIPEVLSQLIEENTKVSNYQKISSSQSKVSFYARIPPEISVEDYFDRIVTYTKAEDNTLITALIYIDRMTSMSHVMLTPNNVHRILFTSILISLKYNEDELYTMDYYAQIAGIEMKELLKLEDDFLKYIKFNLYVDEKEFSGYKQFLLNKIKIL